MGGRKGGRESEGGREGGREYAQHTGYLQTSQTPPPHSHIVVGEEGPGRGEGDLAHWLVEPELGELSLHGVHLNNPAPHTSTEITSAAPHLIYTQFAAYMYVPSSGNFAFLIFYCKIILL